MSSILCLTLAGKLATPQNWFDRLVQNIFLYMKGRTKKAWKLLRTKICQACEKKKSQPEKSDRAVLSSNGSFPSTFNGLNMLLLRVFHDLTVSLADQQLVAGLAILIACIHGITKGSITVYHVNLVYELASLSIGVHFIAFSVIRKMTYEVIPNGYKRQWPAENTSKSHALCWRCRIRRLRLFVRLLFMTTSLGLFLRVVWITRAHGWIDSWTCPVSCMDEQYTDPTSANYIWSIVSLIYTVIQLITDLYRTTSKEIEFLRYGCTEYNRRLVPELKFPPGSNRILFCKQKLFQSPDSFLDGQSEGTSRNNANSSAIVPKTGFTGDRIQENQTESRESPLTLQATEQGDSRQKCTTSNLNSQIMTSRNTSRIYFLGFFKSIFAILISDTFTVFSTIIWVALSIMEIKTLRDSASFHLRELMVKKLEWEENEWGFGQIVPPVMLAALLTQIMDSVAGKVFSYL